VVEEEVVEEEETRRGDPSDLLLPTPQQNFPPPATVLPPPITTGFTAFAPPPPPAPASAPVPAPAPAPAMTPTTTSRIEQRRAKEEETLNRREKDAVFKLQQAERQKQINKETASSIQKRVVGQVQSWAQKKSLIRMLVTLDKIMSPDRIALPSLKLRLTSTASDVRTAYKQALRCVHPDKLSNASMEDRVRGEYVFNALREAFARTNNQGGGGDTQRRGSGGSGASGGTTSSPRNQPVWAQRW